jgi:hypothetical protein
LSKLIHNFYRGKSVAQNHSILKKKLPNENDDPIVENSPNLVTLVSPGSLHSG